MVKGKKRVLAEGAEAEEREKADYWPGLVEALPSAGGSIAATILP